jgi:K+-transporting ATPase A subunit
LLYDETAKLGIDQAAGSLQAGGNMEGKEVRFGVAGSALNTRSDRGSRHNARRSRRGDGGWLASGQGSKSISRFQPLRP